MSFKLTPREIVLELDKYIVGQELAKKSVAIALRNRYRRERLPEFIREEVIPKNILMIGPTGVGKTEIARRLAKMVNAPFLKVEATKFTEVGYVGRDVESMIRELVEVAIRMVKQEKIQNVEIRASEQADEVLLDIMMPSPYTKGTGKNPFDVLFGSNTQKVEGEKEQEESFHDEKARLMARLKRGELNEEYVEIEIEDSPAPPFEFLAGNNLEEMGLNFNEMFGNLFPKKRKKKKVTVKQARKLLTQTEAQKLIDMEEAMNEAIYRAEQKGIIFLDEIDKIAGKDNVGGPDVSRGGVQRDILPIVEGSTVMTKYGPVKTDHILFIAAGAFHTCKPSDLIPELQGRFPIRVELGSLSKDDFKLILTQPKNSIIKQYTELLKTENILLEFTENAIDEIADIAYTVNDQTENIGARRLHTIIEKLLEDLLFDAPNMADGEAVIIDRKYVSDKLKSIVLNEDLSRYIL